MIIYCPVCKTETLLTKTSQCNSNWKCDKCQECCLTKEGIPFQNEKKEQIESSETVLQEIKVSTVIERKRQGQKRQMTLFDYL